jgi:hypothetical protein
MKKEEIHILLEEEEEAKNSSFLCRCHDKETSILFWDNRDEQ